MRSRPVPEFTISVPLEAEPKLRFVAFSDLDLARLTTWLAHSAVLLDLVADLLALYDALADEHEAAA